MGAVSNFPSIEHKLVYLEKFSSDVRRFQLLTHQAPGPGAGGPQAGQHGEEERPEPAQPAQPARPVHRGVGLGWPSLA